MRWWPLIKQFPKYALVLGVIVGSTVLFLGWWVFHSRKADGLNRPTPVEDFGPKLALIQAKYDHLLLVDNDLYDIDDGQLLFKDWLKGSIPLRLFYDATAKKIIGQYDGGFVRFTLDGHENARLAKPTKVAFADDRRTAVFGQAKEVWRADVDWQAFKFINEKKVTSIEQFNEANFADNIALLTSKTLVVRNFNVLLRVDLKTGRVKPVQIPMADIGKRRSPDSKWLVGVMNGQFYCYDVDADEPKATPIGRAAMTDFQWLGNDRCIALVAGKGIASYDRLTNDLTEVTALPFPCFKIGEPSPDGRFIFAAGGIDGRNGALVDLEQKTALKVKGGAGITRVSDDAFAFSREVPDSSLRGSWLQTAGETENRMSPEPFLVSNAGAQLLVMAAAGLGILETQHGLLRMKLDGTELAEPIKLQHPAAHVLAIQRWETE